MRSTTQYLTRRLELVRERMEAGMSTAEYAIGTIAACTFAAILIAVIKEGGVKGALSSVIQGALALGG